MARVNTSQVKANKYNASKGKARQRQRLRRQINASARQGNIQ